MVGTMVDPGTLVDRSSRNISEGFKTPFKPLCFISKMPISFVDPKRF